MSDSRKRKQPKLKRRSKAWKAREAAVAKFHGLVRNPLSGANSGRVGDAYDPDSLKPWVYIECKHYEAHAAVSILEAHRKQVRKVDPDGLCIAALSENRRHGFYVLMHSDEIIEYAVGLLRSLGMNITDEEVDYLAPHNDARAWEAADVNAADREVPRVPEDGAVPRQGPEEVP